MQVVSQHVDHKIFPTLYACCELVALKYDDPVNAELFSKFLKKYPRDQVHKLELHLSHMTLKQRLELMREVGF